jgi:hypothetical protein
MRRRLFVAVALICQMFFCFTNAYASSSPSFKISGPPVTPTIPNDTTAQIPITITPVNGFTGGVELQCGVHSTPPGANGIPTCIFGIVIPTVTITDTKPVVTTLLIATGDQNLPAVAMGTIDRQGPSRYLALIIFPMVALLFGLRNYVFRKSCSIVRCALVAGLLIGTGCGGGNGPRTTPGSYSYQLIGFDTATGGKITASTIITINVP